ncbi:MAG TPA: mandelate racemase/muconate lactonizing enzyme family protein [Acidobacteriaceae bacterium]|jgi:galactonate dehydratase|nr:mandelate racemase/muconate lactonizing enzyme family protein [Acidobacteriaceae bacterium]
MKIEEVKTWLVEGLKYNWVFIKVFTDQGVTGVGEATNWPGSPLVEAACRFVGSLLVGEDPTRIDYLWTKLYKDMNWLGQAGPLLSAISAVDIALWDIAGKRAGLPVYELLGGAYVKDILLYANYWFTKGTGTEQDYSDQAKEVVDSGFTACKLDPFAHTDYRYGTNLRTNLGLTEEQKQMALARLRSVSSAVGSECPIAVETHAMLNGPTAVEMAHRIEAAAINCMWYEEPAGPEFPDAIADIRRRIALPVCVGERLHSRFMFRGILDRHAADIVMPDITRCGGISEMRKIATMCEAYNVPVAPHNPNGPISTIASAHVMASIPNFFRQEFIVQDVSWRDSVLDRPIPVSNGYFHLDDAPGLGFDLDEKQLELHPGVRTPRAGFYV